MNSEWTKVTVGDLVESGEAIVQTGPFGSQLHKHDYVKDGIPIIPTEAIGRGRIVDIIVPRISKEKAKELSRHRLSAGDILFARRGAQATGCSAIVDERYVDGICGTGALLLRVNSPRVHPHYLSLFLSSNFAFEWLRMHAVGAVMPNLNTAIIKALPIALPTMAEQKELSALFGTIDDLGVLLRNTNATVESTAQTLFKSWFINFDPVRAKAEGRAPDMLDANVAGLFPDSLEESELGLIPSGWRTSTINELAEVIDCLHSKKPELLDEGKPFLQLDTIRNDGLLDTTKLAFISESDYSKWISRIEVRGGDCVITNVGRVGAVAQIPVGHKAAMGRNMTAIRPLPNRPFPTFLIELLLSAAMRIEIDRHTDVGTILDSLNVRSIPKLRFVLPPTELLNIFEATVRPLRNAMECNLQKIGTLKSLRDALLPPLISGQLRLPEADALLQDAA